VGHEVDLLIERGPLLDPVEIKSGRTISDEAFASLRRWTTYAGDASGSPSLVYGGQESYVRSGVKVVSWRDVEPPC
jgi:hypothetical protein